MQNPAPFAFIVDMQEFDTAAFREALTTAGIGRALEYRPVLDTTMVLAADMARAGAAHGTLVLAEHQTAGRGRRGRSFHSPPEGNLYFTVILRTAPEIHRRLPVALPVGVALACRMEGCDAGIKWPNDIWASGRKLCGMLIDAEIPPGEGAAIALAGIGINVNGDPATIPELRDTATSLSREVGRHVNRERFLARVCREIEGALGEEPARLLATYRDLSLVLGRGVVLSFPGGETREARAEAIEGDGALLVRYGDGTAEAVTAADVSLRARED